MVCQMRLHGVGEWGRNGDGSCIGWKGIGGKALENIGRSDLGRRCVGVRLWWRMMWIVVAVDGDGISTTGDIAICACMMVV